MAEKVVLVTGAGGTGIGLATCIKFAQEGYTVVATDIAPLEDTQKAVEEAGPQGRGQCLPLYMDVTNKQSVDDAIAMAVETCGHIDVLVNNAARSLGTGILEMSEETWDATQTLVLKSVYLVTRATLPHMLSRNAGGAIINISSVNGLTGIGEEAYAAAKAGVINLTQNLAVRYGPAGIRVNCVAPGTIWTGVWEEREKESPGIVENLKKYYPLGRIGRGEDVANAVVWLAGEKASWVTGVTLNVDGGLMAGRRSLQTDLMKHE